MENEFAKHETDYIKQYEKLGFTDSYRLVNEHLKSLNTEKIYRPAEVTIENEHRYEGMSNPSDMSILYVLKTSDGNKGTLLASYGPNADLELHEFMMAIPAAQKKNDDVLPPDAETSVC